MFNYTGIYYSFIGKEIENFLKMKKISLTKLSEITGIDISTLSKIKNTKLEVEKYPNSISVYQIEVLSEQLNLSPQKLVWGNRKNREEFVKLILVSILINNSSINPFCYFENNLELFKWALKQNCIPEDLRAYLLTAKAVISNKKDVDENLMVSPSTPNTIKKNSDTPLSIMELRTRTVNYFSERYGFFFNKKNFEFYNTLCSNGHNQELEILSNYILEQLFCDFNFTNKYIFRLTTYILNKHVLKSGSVVKEIKKILNRKGEYSAIVLDNKEYDYFLFIDAFNKFWNNKKTEYMKFFNKKLFLNKEIEKTALKKFQNRDIDNLIKSNDFLRLTSESMNMYTEPEAILSYNYAQISYQQIIQKQFFMDGVTDTTLFIEGILDLQSNILEKAKSFIQME